MVVQPARLRDMGNVLQDETARREKERLKAQEEFKKQQLEKLRLEANAEVSAGEVRCLHQPISQRYVILIGC